MAGVTIKDQTCSDCGGVGHRRDICPTFKFEPKARTDPLRKAFDEAGYKTVLKPKTVNFPDAILEWIDTIIKEGFYVNSSEFIRHCISEKLELKYLDYKPENKE